MKQATAKIISNEQVLPGFIRSGSQISAGSWIIWCCCPEIAREARPGQFLMVNCDGACVLPRPFSIHQIKEDAVAILFSVREDGRGTRWLSQLRKEDTVKLFGPLGNGYHIDPAAQNLLLVAGGIGIAPLRFLADEAARQAKKVTLLMGAGSARHLLPIVTAPPLPSGRGLPPINIEKATEDGSVGFKGLATDLIVNHVSRADQIFACGPLPMYRTMAQMPVLKDKPVQVSLEIRMACGLGACYGCTIKTKNGLKQICQDGPVFNLFELSDDSWEGLTL